MSDASEYYPLTLKYRPQKFADVVGQGITVRILKGMIARKRIGSAYLFSGPKGSGKTSMARIFSKALNCQNPDGVEPCGECVNCEDIAASRSTDCVELDAASAGSVATTRSLREASMYSTLGGGYRIWILDEVHNLSKEGFNSLLKIMEEPPPRVVFVLATTDPNKVPDTIISRCFTIPFMAVNYHDVRGRLDYVIAEEGITASPQVLDLVARRSGGALRDALKMIDQLTAIHGTELSGADVERDLGVATRDLVGRVLKQLVDGSSREVLERFKEVWASSTDAREFVIALSYHLRNAAISAVGLEDEVPSEDLGVAKALGQYAKDRGVQWVDEVSRLERALATTRIDPLVTVEMWLVSLMGTKAQQALASAASVQEFWKSMR